MALVLIQKSAQILITCGEFGQVLLLLGFVSKQQNSLKANRLVSSQCDADSQIVTADDLNQASVLEGNATITLDVQPTRNGANVLNHPFPSYLHLSRILFN